MNSHEKFNCISEMVEAGALRTQASGYNLEFKSKFAQKSPLVHKGTWNTLQAKKTAGLPSTMQKANSNNYAPD